MIHHDSWFEHFGSKAAPHSVAVRHLEPCVACGVHAGTAELGFCASCWWDYRLEVTRGHILLAIFLARHADFAAFLEERSK